MAVVRMVACVVSVWAVAGCQAVQNDPLFGSSAAKSSKPALDKSAFEAYGAKPLAAPADK